MAETTGDRIRLLRSGLSQAEFASKLGVHKEMVGKYERCQNIPGGDILARMREVLGVDINWLLTGEGEMPPGLSTPSPTNSPGGINPDLYGRVTEAVSTAYKECGYTATLRQIAAEAAKIAADLSGPDLTPEELPAAIKGAMGQLRRRLREALINPTDDAAGKHSA